MDFPIGRRVVGSPRGDEEEVLDHSTRGYAAAVVGATLGVVGTALVGSLAVASAAGVSPVVVLTLDQDGVMELGGVLLFPYLGIVLLLEGPAGCWVALRSRRARAGLPTSLLLALLSVVSFLALYTTVRSGPDDPVVVPYALVVAVAASAAIARFVVVSTARFFT